MSKAALQEGKCVVIGLQSTGEARTADVVAERGELLDDYVSGPRVSHHACITFIFILYLTVWGVEPVVTHQTSCLESTGVFGHY